MSLPAPMRVRRNDVFSEREVTKLGVVGPQGHQTGAVGLRSVCTMCGPMCALQIAVVVSNRVPDPRSD